MMADAFGDVGPVESNTAEGAASPGGGGGGATRTSRGKSGLSEDYYKTLLARVDEAIVDTQTEHSSEALNASLMSTGSAASHRSSGTCADAVYAAMSFISETTATVAGNVWRCFSRLCAPHSTRRPEGSTRVSSQSAVPNAGMVSAQGHAPMFDV